MYSQLDRVLKELEDRTPWIAQLTQERDELKATDEQEMYLSVQQCMQVCQVRLKINRRRLLHCRRS